MANTRFKTENSLLVTGETSSVFQTNTLFNSAVTVNSATVIVNGALIVGNSASGEPSDLSVTGDLLIAGNLVYTNTSISSDLRAESDGIALGNTSNRFDGYFRNLLIYGYLNPSTNSTGSTLGNNTSRWVISGNTLSLSQQATLDGNLFVGINLLRVSATSNQISVNSASFDGVLNVVGDVKITGTVNSTSNTLSKGLVLDNKSFQTTNNATVTSTAGVVIDKFSNSSFKAVKYFIYASDSTALRHSIELSGVNANDTLLVTQYGEVFNTSLGSFNLVKNTNATDIDLMFTAAGANATNSYTVTVHRNIIY